MWRKREGRVHLTVQDVSILTDTCSVILAAHWSCRKTLWWHVMLLTSIGAEQARHCAAASTTGCTSCEGNEPITVNSPRVGHTLTRLCFSLLLWEPACQTDVVKDSGVAVSKLIWWHMHSTRPAAAAARLQAARCEPVPGTPQMSEWIHRSNRSAVYRKVI